MTKTINHIKHSKQFITAITATVMVISAVILFVVVKDSYIGTATVRIGNYNVDKGLKSEPISFESITDLVIRLKSEFYVGTPSPGDSKLKSVDKTGDNIIKLVVTCKVQEDCEKKINEVVSFITADHNKLAETLKSSFAQKISIRKKYLDLFDRQIENKNTNVDLLHYGLENAVDMEDLKEKSSDLRIKSTALVGRTVVKLESVSEHKLIVFILISIIAFLTSFILSFIKDFI